MSQASKSKPAGAAVSRHLAFLGKALGNEGAISDVLPARLVGSLAADDQPQTTPIEAVDAPEPSDAAHPPGDAAQASALDRLRQRARGSTKDRRLAVAHKPPLASPSIESPPSHFSTQPKEDSPGIKVNALAETMGDEGPHEGSAPSQWDLGHVSAEPLDIAHSEQTPRLTDPSLAPIVAKSPSASSYKPWGSGSTADNQSSGMGRPTPTTVPRTEAKAMSAVERLRMTARGLAPKRLESRDHDRWADPLVDGGAKVPLNYPDEQAWPDNYRPPGSLHDAQSWWKARTGLQAQDYEVMDDEARRKAADTAPAWVIEIMGEKGSVLMRIPKKADDRQDATGMGEFFGQVFDQCLLVMQDGNPLFAGAAEPKKHQHGDQSFWVIRPRDHYLQSWTQTSLFCNAKWSSASTEVDDHSLPSASQG